MTTSFTHQILEAMTKTTTPKRGRRGGDFWNSHPPSRRRCRDSLQFAGTVETSGRKVQPLHFPPYLTGKDDSATSPPHVFSVSKPTSSTEAPNANTSHRIVTIHWENFYHDAQASAYSTRRPTFTKVFFSDQLLRSDSVSSIPHFSIPFFRQ
jgi:hypothetical protein